MSKIEETVLEINLGTLTHNYNHLSSKLKPDTKFLAVVKAFAYGSDAVQVANHLQTIGVNYFAVAYTKEGIALRKGGITLPILVLHPLPSQFESIIEHCLEPNIYSFKTLNAFIETAKILKQNDYPIHIKFNTGLNRLGFEKKDIREIHNILKENTAVKVKSIFSHLAASEDLNERDFTQQQIQKFKTITTSFVTDLGYKPLLHLCNTSGILNYPEAHFDMVRSGIGLYGFGNSNEENKHLKPIASLKSVISQLHTINKGESLGYNRAYIAKEKTVTATIPIGHADGIGRQYGNSVGFVIINNKKAPIVGNVCMDMIMVNVTHIDCKEGDTVIIFDEKFTAENLAVSSKSIVYELITSISQRVKRRIVNP